MTKNRLPKDRKSRAKRSKRKPARRIGPYSSDDQVMCVDRRTREGRFLYETVGNLRTHLGGNLSVPQQMLCQIIAVTWLRINLLAPQLLEDGDSSISAQQVFLAWSNSLRRMLDQVGLESAVNSSGTNQAKHPFDEIDLDHPENYTEIELVDAYKAALKWA